MTAIAAGFITTCAGVGGRWTRITKIDISVGDGCPSGWRNGTESVVSFCRVVNHNPSCSSTYFSTNGTSYHKVCGRARGYQKGATQSFWGYDTQGQTTIDGYYVGSLAISIPAGQHIRTYAAGLCDNLTESWVEDQLFCGC